MSRKSTGVRNRDGAGSTGAGSAGEADAALTTTGRKDGAPGAGSHPETEAMGAAATPVARLESALAHAMTPKMSDVQGPMRPRGHTKLSRQRPPNDTRQPARGANETPQAAAVETTRRCDLGLLGNVCQPGRGVATFLRAAPGDRVTLVRSLHTQTVDDGVDIPPGRVMRSQAEGAR